MSEAFVSYITERIGLICGYLFSIQRAGAEPIDVPAAAQWLGRTPATAGDEFLWLHFNLTHAATENWMREHLGLPEAFFEALREGSTSSRIEHVDGKLIAVINDVIYDFAFESSHIATLWVVVDEHSLISARSRPLRSIDRLRLAVKAGESFDSSAELLIHLLNDQADVLAQIVRQASMRVDSVEDTLLADQLNRNRADLGALRRTLVRLQRLLAPEPRSLFRLLNRLPSWMSDEDAQRLRESTEDFALVVNDLMVLQERIKLLQEEIAARINEHTNRNLFVLTVVTVLALPINITAGLFGMNVGGVPLAQQPWGFWIVALGVVGITALAGLIIFRRQRD